MYYMIGADGKENGPLTAQQVAEWVGAGRANAYSRVRRDGESAWQALSAMPDLADLTASRPDPGVAPPLSPEAIAAQYLNRQPHIDIAAAVRRGWALVRSDPALLVGASALAFLLAIGVALLPSVGWIGGFFANSGLLGGLYFVFIRRTRGEPAEVADIFAGFRMSYLNLVLAYVLSSVLVGAGLVLLILPGIYLAVGYMFAVPLVVDKKMEFWTAMEVSRRVVHAHWWTMFSFAIVTALIIIAGALAFGVGLLLAVPTVMASLAYVYGDLFGRVGSDG
jgi:hypothetical protein